MPGIGAPVPMRTVFELHELHNRILVGPIGQSSGNVLNVTKLAYVKLWLPVRPLTESLDALGYSSLLFESLIDRQHFLVKPAVSLCWSIRANVVEESLVNAFRVPGGGVVQPLLETFVVEWLAILIGREVEEVAAELGQLLRVDIRRNVVDRIV